MTAEPTHPHRRRQWRSRGTAVLFGLSLGWLLLEILLRAAFFALPYPWQATLRHVRAHPFTSETLLPPQIWQDDGDFQFISRNGVNDERQFPDARVGFQVTTKNWLDPHSYIGFRVPDAAWEPRWPVDAVMVGDSFTFCYTEYPQCWVQRLAGDKGLSVVNLGLVATGSRSHLNVLRTFGLPYEPRLVIWQWYGNDFNDDYGFALQRGKIEGASLPSQQAGGPANPLRQWLRRVSAVYLILDTLAFSARREGANRFIDPYQVEVGGEMMRFGRSYTLASTDMSLPKNLYGWEQTKTAVLEANAMAEQANAQLVILLIPAKEEVYAPLTAPALGEERLAALGAGRERMLSLCREQGLLCLDAAPPLMQCAGTDELLYWAGDTHLNDLGNYCLAEAVAAFLLDNGLLTD